MQIIAGVNLWKNADGKRRHSLSLLVSLRNNFLGPFIGLLTAQLWTRMGSAELFRRGIYSFGFLLRLVSLWKLSL